MTQPALKTEWTDVALDDVLRYFVEGFKLRDGAKVVRQEYFVDTVKGRVVFKLTTQPPTDT